jgi:hypothetical protein
MRFIALGALLISCSAPPERCVDEIWVLLEPPNHLSCRHGAIMDVDVRGHAVVVTCSCYKRSEVRLAHAP